MEVIALLYSIFEKNDHALSFSIFPAESRSEHRRSGLREAVAFG